MAAPAGAGQRQRHRSSVVPRYLPMDEARTLCGVYLNFRRRPRQTHRRPSGTRGKSPTVPNPGLPAGSPGWNRETSVFEAVGAASAGDRFGPTRLWPGGTTCGFDTESQAEFKPLPESSLPPSRTSSRTPAIPGPPRKHRYGESVSGPIPDSDTGTSRAIQCGHCPPQT